MKRYISSILALSLLFCMVACTAAEQSISSEELLSSSQEIVSETEMESSETSSYDAVTSINNSSATNTNNTTTSPSVFPSSSQTSSVNNPYISYGGKTGSELMYINPAPKGFNSTEEMVSYLKSIDLREKEFDVIADENIYLTPRIVEDPKSEAAKKGFKNMQISTSIGGGKSLTWESRTEERGLWSVGWDIAKKYQNDSIQTPQELIEHIFQTHHSGTEYPAEVLNKGEQFYVLIDNTTVYWLHEGKYLVSVNNYLNFGNRDELFLLAEDIVFDKHTLK